MQEKKSFREISLITVSYIIPTVIIIFILEGFFSFMVYQRNKPVRENLEKGLDVVDHPKTIVDKALGIIPSPDTTVESIKKTQGKLIYDVHYSYDGVSMRVTPDSTRSPHNKYAQFYGCSFTFGEGLEDDETMPFYFQNENPNFHIYSFAYKGFGPHQMLARLESKQPSKLIKEKDGFAVYFYIDDQVRRLLLGTSSLERYNGLTPYYELKDGKFINHGLFANDHSIESLTYKLMNMSSTLEYFNIEYPFKIERPQYTYAAKMIEAAFENYKSQFNNDNFFVVIYPTPIPYGSNEIIVEELQKLNVKVLDYSTLFDMKSSKYSLENDGHPTALANHAVIKQLEKDLAQLGVLETVAKVKNTHSNHFSNTSTTTGK